MPGRGPTRGGRPSVSVLGKRGRNAAVESVDSEYEPRASGRVRGRGGRQRRGRGRAKGAGTAHRSVAAVRDNSTTTTTTTTSTRSGPYHRGFSQHLLDHNIFPVEYESLDGKEPEPPDNMGEIEFELGTIRALEPADDFRRLRTRYRQVSNEDDALKLLDFLQGDNVALLRSHVIRQKQKMSNLAPLTDGNIVPGNPDRAYGAPATELDKSIRLELDDLVVPTCDKDFICPNFVVHVKSDRGDETIARTQAAYDGALAARGMQALWDFSDRPGIASGIQTSGGDTGGSTRGGRSDSLTDSDPSHQGSARVARVARTITCTWTNGVLRMYATYCEVYPDSREEATSGNLEAELPKYVPSHIGSWIMTAKENQFREGLAAYRNGLDWAKRQRDIVISRANSRVRAEKAHRRRGEEQDPREEHHADGEEQSEGEDNYEQQNNLEEEDRSEEDDGGPSSIFARRGSQARGQDEEDQDCDPADEIIYQSFDSQRTVTTRSMSRKQVDGKRS
ncbi:hypothetical protein INS49_008921 [Diaporthe citri]|uniref:uncharacterized protein n=1 Tax=Diaporthe citri TaxID=83186 RepID=UPI001C7E5966|nr:uncharacterized protein INS49_008921 [Diaporthe citri]KAG6363818.1 hypothetical protein INS49_008921 [Diaporthe citri]